MSRHEYAAVKKCVLSLLRKVDNELVLRMSIGSEFQTFGAATLNARFAVSVRILGKNSRRASVDRSDRIVSWRCSSSSRYGGTECRQSLVCGESNRVSDALLYREPTHMTLTVVWTLALTRHHQLHYHHHRVGGGQRGRRNQRLNVGLHRFNALL